MSLSTGQYETVSSDPWARQEPHRAREYVWHTKRCDWCDQVRQTKTGRTYLYRYLTVTDDGRAFEHRGLFCGKSCHDAYHS